MGQAAARLSSSSSSSSSGSRTAPLYCECSPRCEGSRRCRNIPVYSMYKQSRERRRSRTVLKNLAKRHDIARPATGSSVGGGRRPLQDTDGNSRKGKSKSKTKKTTSTAGRSKKKGEGSQMTERKSPKARRKSVARAENEVRRPATRTPGKPPKDGDQRHRKPRLRDERRMTDTSDIYEMEDLGPKRDCAVCTDSRAEHHFPERPPTSKCDHAANTCKRCLRKWTTTQLETKMWNEIGCPECGARLQYDDMKESAPRHVFRRYEELYIRHALEAIPGFQWCIAKGCKSGQVHRGKDPKLRCVECRTAQCVRHKVPWHAGESCNEYSYRTDDRQKKAEEAASEKLLKTVSKQCPNCKRNIEKNDGCDHMTCKCKYEFCWVCLASYSAIRKKGNRQHKPDCFYYNPPDMMM